MNKAGGRSEHVDGITPTNERWFVEDAEDGKHKHKLAVILELGRVEVGVDV
jgi:hypothetical protein